MGINQVIDLLKSVFKSVSPFEEQELNKISKLFKPMSVKKGTLILHEGDICQEFYCVVSGCIRTYFLDRNGSEKTRYVLFDHYIGTALSSFVTQKPSIEFIDALEDTTLLSISHADFYRLTIESENWKAFYQRILEMAYVFQNRKIEQLVTLTAKQRYDSVLTENPLYIQRLSNKILASYLDMREETLSRLKSK